MKDVLDTGVFESLSALIREESGISLNKNKRQLLMGRLQRRIRNLGLSSLDEYLEYLRAHQNAGELRYLIDAVSTNVTSFMREKKHFEFLTDLCETWKLSRRDDFRVWSAAASTGEELVSAAITIHECSHELFMATRFLGTDINSEVVELAAAASYESRTLESLDPRIRKRYFRQIRLDGRDYFEVIPELRAQMLFRRMNLSQFPYPLKVGLDVIFLRNVMIYFDRTLRQRIIQEISRLLRPGGVLILGLSENLLGFEHPLLPLGSSVYQRPLGVGHG